jgi:alginate O-acetyltransferase complex protein AlgJ
VNPTGTPQPAEGSPPGTPSDARIHGVPRMFVAVLAAVFFLTPLVLIAAGVRVSSFENRRLAPPPQVSAGWFFFNDATRYLIDRLPLRRQAVQANTWIDEHVFSVTPFYGQNGLGGVQSDNALPFSGRPQQDRAAVTATTATTSATGKTPAPTTTAPPPPPPTASQVTAGRDGWLFLEGTLDRACTPFMAFPAALAEWERLLAVIRASGRRVELIIAPDKSSIYPEYLDTSNPKLACGLAGANALWKQVESHGARRAGVIGLRQPMLAAKRNHSPLLYYKTDSHWNSVGSLAMAKAALVPLSPTVRVSPSDIVNTGSSHYAGDLLGLLGQSGGETAPSLTVRRPPGAQQISAPTLVLGDSYADAALPEMTPYFSQLKSLNWNEATRAQQVAGIIAAHDVILETVEREFDYRATSVGFAAPGFVTAVADALRAHPLR